MAKITTLKRFLSLGFVFSNFMSLLIAEFLNRSEATIRIASKPFCVPLPISIGLKKSLIMSRYEGNERLIVNRIINDGDQILELGSAIGCLAVTYANKSSRTHTALDANPEMIRLMNKNLSRNGIRNVTAIQAIAGAENGKSKFYIHNDFYSSSADRPTEKIIKTDIVDVNSLLVDQKPNVIICDIEGGEYGLFEVLDLKYVNKIIMEVHEAPDQETKLLSLLSVIMRAGFHFDLRNWRGNVLVFQKH